MLELLPVNNEKELFKWLLQLPNRARLDTVVTIDMCVEYRSLVQKMLPLARIVVDRYHVHNLLNVALGQVLDVIRACLIYTENREYMRPEHLLTTSYRRLSEEREKDEKGIEQPSPKEVIDKWLEDVPDIARAYQLKEDFSDILQLTDRQKAEELTDLWLERAIQFVEYFRAKYQRKYRKECPDPFGNVPNTIHTWRHLILNYIDYKHLFIGRKTSNSFAEFTNGRIKKAYNIGNHYSYQVLRLKVKYGGVTVKRRPPHPLDKKQLRITRGNTRPINKKHRKKNPDANLERLKKAREDMDETRGLMDKPQETPEWLLRFNAIDRVKAITEVDEQELAPDVTEQSEMVEENQQSEFKGRSRRPFRFNPDQGKLF